MMNDTEAKGLVSYLGPEGTYSHRALLRHFGKDQRCCPVAEIQDVFSSVEAGESEYGLVPVENSTAGSITLTLDRFNSSELTICAEVRLRIHHFLMASKETQAGSIHKIVSHQQSLGQCREWLAENYPAVEQVAVSSNAEAAMIAAREPGVAAIAGEAAVKIYQLQVLAQEIEDADDNTTRFWVISRQHNSESTGKDKTSLIILADNEPGTLFKTLEPFQRFGVNLTKLESRPSRQGTWSYSFYVDIDGHINDANVQSALSELQLGSLGVRVLGSYPVAS